MVFSSNSVFADVNEDCTSNMDGVKSLIGEPDRIDNSFNQDPSSTKHLVIWEYSRFGWKKIFKWGSHYSEPCIVIQESMPISIPAPQTTTTLDEKAVGAAADHESADTNYCRSSMLDVSTQLGLPQTVRQAHSDAPESNTVVWEYPDLGVKKLFEWVQHPISGAHECQVNEWNMTLSEKGKKLQAAKLLKEIKARIPVIQKEHPGWSKKACRAVAEKKVFIGMTRNQVIESWGNPDHVNRTIGVYGQSEQWVFGNEFLYFDEGKLSTMQLSR